MRHMPDRRFALRLAEWQLALDHYPAVGSAWLYQLRVHRVKLIGPQKRQLTLPEVGRVDKEPCIKKVYTGAPWCAIILLDFAFVAHK